MPDENSIGSPSKQLGAIIGNEPWSVESALPLGFGRIYREDIDSDEYRKLSGGAQRVYVALCCYADGSGTCYPSQTTLAKMVGRTRENVNRSIRELVAAGFVKKMGITDSSKVVRYQVHARLQEA